MFKLEASVGKDRLADSMDHAQSGCKSG
jgi:hypothetical protein